MNKKRIAVLCSGGGSNLQALLDAIDRGEIAGEVVLVLASRQSAYALTRARSRGIEAHFLSRKALGEGLDAHMRDLLVAAQIDLVVLAGYLCKIGPRVLQSFSGRILNIHPGLLPAFGGQGMYGHFVHEAVLAAGCKVSGATVHLVDGEYDHGPILAQEAVPVLPGDDAETLAARVLAVEHQILPRCVADFCAGKIQVDGKRVSVVQ